MPQLPLFHDRRSFLKAVAIGGLTVDRWLAIDLAAGADSPEATGFPALDVFSGTPVERGRAYGQRFKDPIQAFLDKEIYAAFTGKPATRAEMLRYAGACAKVVREYTPEVHAELEGVASGADLSVDELVLLNLHEELYHKGVLPKIDHCTAVAVGPPETRDGHTFVGQTWDWMQSAFGLSRVVHWQRQRGPSVLAYGFPGLWVGAGLNSAGLAFCWTSAGGQAKASTGARVGIPSYALLAHLLYQDSLEAVATEAQRLPQAGWFTFVFADGKGNLLNLEGSPTELVVERAKGRMTRVGYGSRAMTRTPPDQPVALHKRCRKVCELFDASAGQVDLGTLQTAFADPKHEVNVGKSTIDMMVFNTTTREAYFSRGSSYQLEWKRFGFA